MMNSISRVAAIDAAAELGLQGIERFDRALAVLNEQGVPTRRDTLDNAYKKRKQLQQEPLYSQLKHLFKQELAGDSGASGN